MLPSILFIDDDAIILQMFKRLFRERFLVDTALSGQEGLKLISEGGNYAVVVADMQMPEMDGVEVLSKVAELAPDTVRIMLTGNVDQQTATDAVNEGKVFQFLTKPCSAERLVQALQNGLTQHRLIRAERELLNNTLNGTTGMLTEILSSVNPRAFGQSQKLKTYLNRFSFLFQGQIGWEMELAVMLCPIGYVTLPAELIVKLHSGFLLSGEEKDMVKRVPEIGRRLIEKIPRLEKVAKIVYYQNKHFDGTGFPADSIAGDSIPIESRYMKMFSDLIHHEDKGLPMFKALGEMRGKKGVYDPCLLDSMVSQLENPAQNMATFCEIELKELKVNDLVISNIETKEGVKLVDKGTLITPLIMEKLYNFEINFGIKTPILIQN